MTKLIEIEKMIGLQFLSSVCVIKLDEKLLLFFIYYHH